MSISHIFKFPVELPLILGKNIILYVDSLLFREHSCKGNNIFKILGNPHPTCLPNCGMPLGLGRAFLSPLILRLF